MWATGRPAAIAAALVSPKTTRSGSSAAPVGGWTKVKEPRRMPFERKEWTAERTAREMKADARERGLKVGGEVRDWETGLAMAVEDVTEDRASWICI